nr:MAG TPA: hypothetical protein [Caudoviricetes sp.]
MVYLLNRRSRVRIAQEAPKTQGRWLAVYLFCLIFLQVHPFCTPSASQIKKRIPVRIKVLTI